MKQPHTLLDLIKFILKWFLARRSSKRKVQKIKYDKMHLELKNKYNEIDANANKQKRKSIKSRLDNMFNN